MDLSAKSGRANTVFVYEGEEEDGATEPSRIGKLFIRKHDTKTQDFGFVFTKTGTEKLRRTYVSLRAK